MPAGRPGRSNTVPSTQVYGGLISRHAIVSRKPIPHDKIPVPGGARVARVLQRRAGHSVRPVGKLMVDLSVQDIHDSSLLEGGRKW
jgi:hypothetical protein